MRFPAFISTFALVVLTACAAPAPGSPNAPSLDREPTLVPVKRALDESLLVVEWKGHPEGNLLYPLDPATGAAIPGFEPVSLGESYSHAFSPDRSSLAAMTSLNNTATTGNLFLIDLATWKTRQLELKPNGWVTAMIFSPDGKRLAIADGVSPYRLTIFDLEQGVVAAQKEVDFLVTRMKFTAGGESLMLYGMVLQNRFTENEKSGGPPQVHLFDAVDLTPLWSDELDSVRDGIHPTDEKVAPAHGQPGTAMYLSPAVIFAPDHDSLYVLHADSDKLTIVDFDGQRIETLEVQAGLTWFERLLSLTAGVAHAKIADGTSKQAAVSPDGQFLYVVGMRSESVQDKHGNWQMNQIPLGLQIVRTRDGSRVERFETDAAELSLSLDGRFLYLRNWTEDGPWTEIFDLSTRQVLMRKPWIHGTPAMRLNGEPLLVSTHSTGEFSHHMSVFLPDGSRLLSEWSGSDYVSWLTP